MTTYTIPESDLAAVSYGSQFPEKLQRVRSNETELPQKLEVIYTNLNTDYQQDMEYSERKITNADGVLSINIPVIMNSDKAAQIAEILLHNLWVERVSYELTLPFKYAYLDPTDRISITINNSTHLIRITEIDYQPPLLINIKGVAESNSVYISNATGGVNNFTAQTVGLTGATNFKFLDIPILRSQDNSNGYYIAATGYYSNWPGCVLHKSTDSGETYSELTTLVNSTPIGNTTDTLSSTPYPWQWDYSSTVNVKLLQGSLSGTSKLNVMAGLNHALVGNEIIGFVNATLEGDGTYTLDTLLRGRVGTDKYIGTHTSSDQFVLLDSNTMGRVEQDSGSIGTQYDYKAVTFGKTLAETSNQTFTNNAVCLKPFSPVHVKGIVKTNGDWRITWIRRTRFGGEWQNLVNVPLNEASQKYLVQIHSNPTSSSIVRTLATVTTPSAVYTSAQMITDFGTAQSSITVGIFQISDTVGNGFIRKATL